MGGYLMDKLEEQLTELQTRLAFQDHTIHELNDVITDQQKQIDRLSEKLRLLDDKLKTLEDAVPASHDPVQERPPHY